MYKFAIALIGAMWFFLQVQQACAQASNKVEWVSTYPRGGHGNFTVKGTATPKAGWRVKKITVKYKIRDTMNWSEIVLPGTGPGFNHTQTVGMGHYDLKVEVKFEEIANTANTEDKAVEGIVYVHAPPNE